MTDEDLITSYLKGDELSLPILFERYLKQIYRFSFCYVNNKDIASDIAQEVFIKVWKNLKKFDTNRSFKTWLYKIAKNTVYDYFKKKRINTFSDFENDSIVDSASSDNETAFEIFEKIEDSRLVAEAISKLPIIYQDVINLYYFNELTFNEISEITEESINTVKSRHLRAIKKLKIDLNI